MRESGVRILVAGLAIVHRIVTDHGGTIARPALVDQGSFDSFDRFKSAKLP
jgi:hypothetical protein